VEPIERAAERMVGASVQAGYFAQNLAESLHYEKTVLDELGDSTEGPQHGGNPFDPRRDCSSPATTFYKKVSVLSGGGARATCASEGARAAEQLLLLDEPTNNLDIVAKVRCSTRSGVFRAP